MRQLHVRVSPGAIDPRSDLLDGAPGIGPVGHAGKDRAIDCRKSVALLLAGALLAWGCGDHSSLIGPNVADGGAGSAVSDSLFADSGLAAAVRAALGRPEGKITQAELSSLKDLDASGRGIKGLTNIGRLDSLRSLNLADNEVTDLSPLAALTRLEYLDLSRNHVTEISALASLTQLKVLVLEQDAVPDLSPLQGLSHLERLELTEGTAESAVTTALQARGVKVIGINEPASEVAAWGGDVGSPAVTERPRIAFSMRKKDMGSDLDIWVMAPDGSGQMPLICSEVDETQPAWSPDGTQLVFAKGGYGFRDIFVLRSGEKNPVGLSQERGRDEHSPSWSPDGTRIAYVRDGEIYTMWADGADKKNLTQHPAEDRDPSWSPDGKLIAFASSRDIGNAGKQFDIFVMDADGGNQVNLTHHPSMDFGPAFSPDGTRIAFYSDRDRNGHSVDAFVMGADGSQPVNLTSSGSITIFTVFAFFDQDHPSWSPDGQRIVSVCQYRLCTFALDGSDLTMLMDEYAGTSHPTWIADAAVDLSGVSQ